MRGENSTQGHMFTYLSPEQRVPADHPLRAIKVNAGQVLIALYAKRTNVTHCSTTDPEARLMRKANGQQAQLRLNAHDLMENRNGLLVDLKVACDRIRGAGDRHRDAQSSGSQARQATHARRR